MLDSFKTLFKANKAAEQPSEDELRLAAATLMFELIRSDGRIDQIELSCMSDILRKEFDIDQTELDNLLEQAKETANEAISLHSFTREICENWGNEKRLKLLEYLWVLALADEQIDPHERHLVRKVAGLLYLNDAEVSRAREAAKRSLNI